MSLFNKIVHDFFGDPKLQVKQNLISLYAETIEKLLQNDKISRI